MTTETNKAYKVMSDRYDVVVGELARLRADQVKLDAHIEDVQRTKYALERAMETLLPGVTPELDHQAETELDAAA